MTESTGEHNQAKPNLADLLGNVFLREDLPKELQDEPGLIWVEVEGQKVCPEVQFVPDADELELNPYLSRAWELARREYGAQDPTAETTFHYFITPDERWGGGALWDVAVADDTDTVWERIRTQVETDFRELAEKSKH